MTCLFWQLHEHRQVSTTTVVPSSNLLFRARVRRVQLQFGNSNVNVALAQPNLSAMKLFAILILTLFSTHVYSRRVIPIQEKKVKLSKSIQVVSHFWTIPEYFVSNTIVRYIVLCTKQNSLELRQWKKMQNGEFKSSRNTAKYRWIIKLNSFIQTTTSTNYVFDGLQ